MSYDHLIFILFILTLSIAILRGVHVGQRYQTNSLYAKKAIRLITFSKWNSHTSPLFKSNNILKVFDLNVLQVGCFVFKAMNNLLQPAAFTNFFMLNSNVHSHETRSSSNIHVVGFSLNV